MLLWHGSRSTNFAGILKQGLRIAPPEGMDSAVVVLFLISQSGCFEQLP
jgi:poly [ADP-ribose] polymerase 2/3/4